MPEPREDAGRDPAQKLRRVSKPPHNGALVFRVMNPSDVQARAELCLAQVARDTSDLARGIVGDTLVPMAPGERVRAGLELRIQAQSVVDDIVILEVLSGSTWQEVANEFHLPAAELERRYGAVVELWRAGQPVHDLTKILSGEMVTGSMQDTDPAGTAAAIDQWYARHAEPWEQPQALFGSRFG